MTQDIRVMPIYDAPQFWDRAGRKRKLEQLGIDPHQAVRVQMTSECTGYIIEMLDYVISPEGKRR